jgi:hypothetical protein
MFRNPQARRWGDADKAMISYEKVRALSRPGAPS